MNHTNGKLPVYAFDVNITCYEFRSDDNPGFYIPADKMAKLIETELIDQAANSVKEITRFVVTPADTSRAPLLSMLAKVQVHCNVKNSEGFSALSQDGAAWMFQLKNDIVELIEDLEPPRSAWIPEGKKLPKPKKAGKKRKPGRQHRKGWD
jgi:hypothetical protein